MKKVLIMEDESNVRSFVVINLQRAGYEVVEAVTGEQALEQLRQNADIGVAILDVTVPGIDGFEVCRWIRAADRPIGVIMLTGRAQEMDRVNGLMTGVDEYLVKPFSPAELIAGVNVLFERLGVGEKAEDILTDGPFKIHISRHALEKNGEVIPLTKVEYDMIRLFMSQAGKILSREELLQQIWSGSNTHGLAVVDVTIRRLRMKIEEDPENPQYIQTIWGWGYQWKPLTL